MSDDVNSTDQLGHGQRVLFVQLLPQQAIAAMAKPGHQHPQPVTWHAAVFVVPLFQTLELFVGVHIGSSGQFYPLTRTLLGVFIASDVGDN